MVDRSDLFFMAGLVCVAPHITFNFAVGAGLGYLVVAIIYGWRGK